MLCTLAIRATPDGGCTLRVIGSTALGPSGTGGRDGKQYATAESLFRDLASFELDQDVIATAARELINPESRRRFLTFAEDVQIPFDRLERADIFLFDGTEQQGHMSRSHTRARIAQSVHRRRMDGRGKESA